MLAELQKTLAEKKTKSKGLTAALKNAIESRQVDLLEKAIDDYKAAGLTQVRGRNHDISLLPPKPTDKA